MLAAPLLPSPAVVRRRTNEIKKMLSMLQPGPGSGKRKPVLTHVVLDEGVWLAVRQKDETDNKKFQANFVMGY